LGLGSGGIPGGSSYVAGGGWGAASTACDFESEICSLRAAVDASQRGLAQLENKLASRLEHICRRHVDDLFAGAAPLQELKSGFTHLQNECRHLELEINRLPAARDIDSALEKYQATLESRLGERVGSLERSVTQQQQQAIEKLEGRGGETWRVCLQRMSALEERVVLQADTPRIIERVLAEVRRAGPDLLGAGIATGPASVAEVRASLRRVEAKVAGCEARLLGLSEDSSAEGRVWRASVAAKVEQLDRTQHNVAARLAGCEASQVEIDDGAKRVGVAAEAAARAASDRADEAAVKAREAKEEAIAYMEALLHEQVKSLDTRVRSKIDAGRRETEALQLRLQAQEQYGEDAREERSESSRERAAMADNLAALRAEVASIMARLGAVATTAREGAEKELARGLSELRHDMQVRIAACGGTFEGQFAQLRANASVIDGRLSAIERRLVELASSVARVEAIGATLEEKCAKIMAIDISALATAMTAGDLAGTVAGPAAFSPDASMHHSPPSFTATPPRSAAVVTHSPEMRQTDPRCLTANQPDAQLGLLAGSGTTSVAPSVVGVVPLVSPEAALEVAMPPHSLLADFGLPALAGNQEHMTIASPDLDVQASPQVTEPVIHSQGFAESSLAERSRAEVSTLPADRDLSPGEVLADTGTLASALQTPACSEALGLGEATAIIDSTGAAEETGVGDSILRGTPLARLREDDENSWDDNVQPPGIDEIAMTAPAVAVQTPLGGPHMSRDDVPGPPQAETSAMPGEQVTVTGARASAEEVPLAPEETAPSIAEPLSESIHVPPIVVEQSATLPPAEAPPLQHAEEKLIGQLASAQEQGTPEALDPSRPEGSNERAIINEPGGKVLDELGLGDSWDDSEPGSAAGGSMHGSGVGGSVGGETAMGPPPASAGTAGVGLSGASGGEPSGPSMPPAAAVGISGPPLSSPLPSSSAVEEQMAAPADEESDWDASGSADIGAVAKISADAASSASLAAAIVPPEGRAAGRTPAVEAPAPAPAPTCAPAQAAPPAPAPSAARAPLPGSAAELIPPVATTQAASGLVPESTSRFGLSSPLDVLQEQEDVSGSFGDDDALPLEGSNSWDGSAGAGGSRSLDAGMPLPSIGRGQSGGQPPLASPRETSRAPPATTALAPTRVSPAAKAAAPAVASAKPKAAPAKSSMSQQGDSARSVMADLGFDDDDDLPEDDDEDDRMASSWD